MNLRFLSSTCLLLAAAGLLGSAPVSAQQAPLASWTVSTGSAPVAQRGGTMVIASGSQLVRTFEAPFLAVRLVSRPFFSVDANAWPALEVGPAGVTFTRDPRGGGLVLLGDRALALPYLIELDEEGRSKQQLELTLAYDGAQKVAKLTIGGETYRLAAAASNGSVEVAISSGTEKPWPIDGLEITSGANDSGELADEVDPSDTTDKRRKSDKTDLASQHVERARRLDWVADLFRQGRDAAALALISGGERVETSATWDLLVVCYQLCDRGDYSTARRVAVFVQPRLEVVASDQTRSSTGRAQAKVMLAGLENYVLGEPLKALELYDQAVALDPGQKHAAEQVKRLMPVAQSKGEDRK